MAQSSTSRIQPGETAAVALSFVYFFCVLAAYYVIRPVREQLSAAVGSTQLPVFYAATFVATLVLTPLFAALAVRVPRRVLVPAVYGVFIACLLGFVPLFAQPGLLSPKALGAVFYVWLSIFNLFVVSVFWSFMADVWNQLQARRLFPVIALGGTAGSILGPTLAGMLVGRIGVAPLLVVSATLLAVALACAARLGRWARTHASSADAAQGRALHGTMFDGLRQVVATPFVRNMALLMVLSDCIGTVNYALVADYSGSIFHDAVARTQFAAGIDLVTNVLVVLVQLTVTRWLLVRGGAGPVIATWALVTAAVLVWVATTPDPHAPVIAGLPAVALALIISRGLAYGMSGPARESLFTRVPREQRYLGKNAVDTAVWRAGDAATAGTMNLLRAVGAGVPTFAVLAAGAALGAGALGWRLASQAMDDEGVPLPAR
jgi:AAA family ATP:ADP antiporter